MFEYFQTTGLILLWTLLLSGLTSLGAYYFIRSIKSAGAIIDVVIIHQPALSLAVLIIFFAYKFFNLNLLFPVHLLTGWKELVTSAFVPALILNLASGLTLNILKTAYYQYYYWQQKTFYQTRRAFGLEPTLGIRRLVILKSIVTAWSNCIPWVFGELLIIESVFNAPGMGLAIWHQAKIRDLEAMLITALWFLLLYFTVYMFSVFLHSWLGKKLEGYN